MSLRLPLSNLREGERDLDADASKYLLRVHRLCTGARCVAFDPAACLEADLEVIATGRRGARVRLSAVRAASAVATREITLIQGLAKGSKIDAVVRDATELGATRIIVARCERSVKRDVDVARCRRIALDAARQSGRGDLPRVEGPTPFVDALHGSGDGLRVILLPDATRFLGELDIGGDLVLAVGPEGGFSNEEQAAALAAGFVAARLGHFVLRTETACAAALGAAVSRK